MALNSLYCAVVSSVHSLNDTICYSTMFYWVSHFYNKLLLPMLPGQTALCKMVMHYQLPPNM